MGLLDVLNGMQNGPRGPSDQTSGAGGGMSPMTMAILALLAYKAVKHFGGGQAAPAGQAPSQIPAGPATSPDVTTASTGGLGGGLGGLLGGLLAGGAAGSILSGGLGDLLEQFEQNGHSEAANSWVGNGPNKQISPNDLESALGADQINALSAQTGMSRDDLLSGLAQQLPNVINQLTPDGRMPTEHEASRWI
ncbi:MAG: YidB family protein [Afipia sp.]